jgi:hypothetical protein
VLPPPSPGEQHVGVKEGHIDADGGPQGAEDDGQAFPVARDVKARESPDELAEVHAGPQDDQEEGPNHHQEEVFEDPLEMADGPPAPPPVAPAEGRPGDEQCQGDRGPRNGHPGDIEKVPHDAHAERVLGELPDDRGQENGRPPGHGQSGVELFPESVVGPGLGRQELMPDGREHDHPKEHGHGLDPQQLVAEDRPGEDGRAGRSGAEGQGALDPAGTGDRPVAPPALPRFRPGIDLPEKGLLFIQGLGVPGLDHGQAAAQGDPGRAVAARVVVHGPPPIFPASRPHPWRRRPGPAR